MALKKCKECGHEVSKKADTCPNCGAPQRAKHYGCGSLIFLLLVAGFIGSLLGNPNTPPPTPVLVPSAAKSTPPKPEKTEAKKVADYIAKLTNEIDGVENHKATEELNSKELLMLNLSIYSIWAEIAEEGNTLPLDGEGKALLANFKKKLSANQVKMFPKIRDAYSPIANEALWENDISARTIGNGFSTIEFTGGLFIRNRNIKDFQGKFNNILHLMRFKKAIYLPYKKVREYTSYDIKSPADSDLIVWSDNSTQYREIE